MNDVVNTLIEERPEGDYFTGNIEAAKRLLLDEYGDSITVRHYTSRKTGQTYVEVTEHRGGSAESPNQWGNARDEDTAWRYLAGADFGPVDSEYDEARLIEALSRFA